ncbi:hypothetical protein NAI53_09950, partial [Francisella tularensis subsp. holarctica]|nr:hypothetical protein [Francisella tularensis subsp. holarctica]
DVMILYQYSGNSHDNRKQDKKFCIDLITNGSIQFTNPIDFNDPFDCYPNSGGNAVRQGELGPAVVGRCNSLLHIA